MRVMKLKVKGKMGTEN